MNLSKFPVYVQAAVLALVLALLGYLVAQALQFSLKVEVIFAAGLAIGSRHDHGARTGLHQGNGVGGVVHQRCIEDDRSSRVILMNNKLLGGAAVVATCNRARSSQGNRAG